MVTTQNKKTIAIIIPVFNRKDITLCCLQQLADVSHHNADITVIVVDDGSTDGTAEAINQQFPKTVVLKEEGDLWWTGAINVGVSHALKVGFDYVLFLNDDLEFETNFIDELLQVAAQSPTALVSSLKLRPGLNSKYEIAAGVFKTKGWLGVIYDEYSGLDPEQCQFADNVECEILTGASLLIPAQVFKDIGLLDNRRFPHNWGDFEFTKRANINGYPCLLAPKSIVYIDGNNPNYHSRYIVESSRSDYLKNLFENRRYNYGFTRIWHNSHMHKGFVPGSVLFLKRFLGEVRWVFRKVFYSNEKLKSLVQ